MPLIKAVGLPFANDAIALYFQWFVCTQMPSDDHIDRQLPGLPKSGDAATQAASRDFVYARDRHLISNKKGLQILLLHVGYEAAIMLGWTEYRFRIYMWMRRRPLSELLRVEHAGSNCERQYGTAPDPIGCGAAVRRAAVPANRADRLPGIS
jgi:hypothetical protein